MRVPPVSTLNCGSYETPAGQRDVVLIDWYEIGYAIFDQRHAPDGDGYDARCVEADLPTLAEAEALARDYLDNARATCAPLVRAA